MRGSRGSAGGGSAGAIGLAAAAIVSGQAETVVCVGANQQGAQRFSEQVLTNAAGFEGVDGLFRFRPDGMIERGLAVQEVRNGTAVTVNAAPREFGRSA
jgi:hypothetical protein